MINPLQMIQMISNPNKFLMSLMSDCQYMNNPMMKNAVDMFQKGNTQGLQELANNLCKNKGTSIDEIRKQFNL